MSGLPILTTLPTDPLPWQPPTYNTYSLLQLQLACRLLLIPYSPSAPKKHLIHLLIEHNLSNLKAQHLYAMSPEKIPHEADPDFEIRWKMEVEYEKQVRALRGVKDEAEEEERVQAEKLRKDENRMGKENVQPRRGLKKQESWIGEISRGLEYITLSKDERKEKEAREKAEREMEDRDARMKAEAEEIVEGEWQTILGEVEDHRVKKEREGKELVKEGKKEVREGMNKGMNKKMEQVLGFGQRMGVPGRRREVLKSICWE